MWHFISPPLPPLNSRLKIFFLSILVPSIPPLFSPLLSSHQSNTSLLRDPFLWLTSAAEREKLIGTISLVGKRETSLLLRISCLHLLLHPDCHWMLGVFFFFFSFGFRLSCVMWRRRKKDNEETKGEEEEEGERIQRKDARTKSWKIILRNVSNLHYISRTAIHINAFSRCKFGILGLIYFLFFK